MTAARSEGGWIDATFSANAAAAREILIAAAAQRWNVDRAKCRAEKSTGINTETGLRMSFGSLAEDAAKLPVPVNVRSERFPADR